MPGVAGDKIHQPADDAFRRALIAPLLADAADDTLVRRVYHSLDNHRAVALFQSDSSSLYSVAHDFIRKNLIDPDLAAQVCSFLESGHPGVIPLLRSLASFALPDLQALKNSILSLTESDQFVASELATKVICFRYPELIWSLTENMSPSVRSGLCYAQKSELIPTLIESWGRDSVLKQPPISLGIAINARVVAQYLKNDPELGFALARAYGYVDDQLDFPDEVTRHRFCELLERDLLVVDPTFLELDADELDLRELDFVRYLQPWATREKEPVYPVINFENKVDKLLLLSAMRCHEKTNFHDKINEKPHSERGRENLRWIEFAYAPFSYSQRELFTKPILQFKQLNLPQQYLGQYVIEYASCRLERDSQLQDEQLLFFESRWAHAAKRQRKPLEITSYPIFEDNPYGAIAELVLKQRPRKILTHSEPTSQGAHAAELLLNFQGRADLIQPLLQLEKIHKGILPTIGIEIQCPTAKDRRAESFAWKQALREFEIPSPRRPEYRSMVEAALPPAFSYHSHIASLLLLRELGLFNRQVDMALHISLGGQLGLDVRYILFAQQFIAPPTDSPPGQKLMSKGFAHQHQDGVNPYQRFGEKNSLGRTELRSMRISTPLTASQVFPHFIDDIITIHLLSTALNSTLQPTPNSAMIRLWGEFKSKVEFAASSYPPLVGEFLQADWYERSGDSSDSRLMGLLTIVERQRAVKKWIKEVQIEESLRAQFTQIRNESARAIFEALPKGKVYRDSPQLFAQSEAGIPFLNPRVG